MDEQDEYLTAREAAKFLMMTEKTLRNWRSLGIGPPYAKYVGKILYRLSDLKAYLEEHTYKSTKDYGKRKPPKQPPAEPGDAAP
jgi:Helix-turn-helix domain